MIDKKENLHAKTATNFWFIYFKEEKWNAAFPLRHFLDTERIGNSYVQRYYKTLEENFRMKQSKSEHWRESEKEAGQRMVSYIK